MGLPQGKQFHIEKVNEETSIPMNGAHVHDYYEIYYLIEGQRRYFINHTLYSLEAGDAIFVAKGDIHQTQPINSANHERYLLTFSDKFLESISSFVNTDLILNSLDTKKIHIPNTKRHSFVALLNKLYSEYTNTDDKYSQALAFLHMSETLITLCQRMRQGSTEIINDLNIPEERIQNACRYICNYYNQSITLNDISKIAFMSPTYFSKKFKKVTGFGFNEYLNNVRVKIATNMLVETQYSITEIALYCGYQDSNYFGDVFKKIIGTSPSVYRKEHTAI